MEMQVTITRTDNGANTKVKSHNGEASKDYASWNSALEDAQALGLISALEGTAAKVLPPGFPLHTHTDVEPGTLHNNHFILGKTTPAQ
jgi:hypothetical protein